MLASVFFHFSKQKCTIFIRSGKRIFSGTKLSVINLTKVSKFAAALLMTNGILWAIAGAVFGGTVAVAFPSYNSLLKAGIGAAAGYPAAVVRQLAWGSILHRSLFSGYRIIRNHNRSNGIQTG